MTYTYDSYHNVTSATSAEGIKYTLTYDTWGNNETVKIGNTISSSADYSDDGNRLVSTTDAVGNVTTYSYDEDTNVLMWVQYPKDNDNTQTVYTYDSMYRLATATATTDTGLSLSASYTYQNDYLTSIATPSTTYNFTYGNFGLRSAVKVGSQTLASYTYESGTNLLKTLAYGNGDSVQYTYDTQGRLTQQSYEDSDTVTYLYDNDGALSTVIDSASGSKTKYFYDFAGLLTKFTENRGSHSRRVEYTYTEENQVSQKSEFAGSVRQNTYFRYDDFHRRTQVGTSSTWWKYTYDTLGRVATQRFTVSGADILTETVTYNNANQVTSIQKVTPENTRIHSYTYDDNGNIATVTVGNKTIRYTYDTAGQLIREDNPSTYLTTVWTYDRAGNILTEKDYAYTTGTPYELLGTNSYTYSDGEWKDLLIAYNGQSITYDQIGNPTSYYNGTAWTFTWEHGRQLATMTSGTTTWTNTYNSDGLRTSRTNGTITYNYYYEGSQLTEVTGSNGNIWIFYDGNRPVIIKYGDTATYHYELNLQGDVIAILDSDGNRVVEYTYDAWGKILSITGSMKDTLGQANPLRYRGYVYDPETQLYYLQSRYYDPQTRRFLNSDIVYDTDAGLQGYNLFIYCGNNPINRIDISGEDSSELNGARDLLDDPLLESGGGGNGKPAGGGGGSGGSGVSFSDVLDEIFSIFDMASQTMKDGTSYMLSGGFRTMPSIPACFVSGTLVHTAEGFMEIESITVGDSVWAWDEESGDVALKRVVETYVNETDELVHIFVNGEEIITTSSHPFYSPVKGWTEAVRLRAGDVLVLVNGEYVVVEKVQHEILETPITVYNFQVEDYHTYYVSDSGVLVHNSCSIKNTTTPWDTSYNSRGSVSVGNQTAQYDGTYYWLRDTAGHGGSYYKVYKRIGSKLYWQYDADMYGNFIYGKHKSDDGIVLRID